jgi:hypothetical protein
MDRLASVEGAVGRLGIDLKASNKGLAAALAAVGKQVAALAGVVAALPIMASAANTASPVNANTSSWATKASVTIPVPTSKTTASLSTIGSVALLDTVTGGIAAPPSARFLIEGTVYPITNGVPASKDPGASSVNNVVPLGPAATPNVPGQSSIPVALQVSVPHATAYATNSSSNFATLSAQAIFS